MTSDATTPLPAAVLWDMDGTLVDTEPYWIRAEHELVAAHGGSWSHEQALELVGNPLTVSAELLQAAGVDLPVAGIVDHLLGKVRHQVDAEVPWRPGARELLAALGAAGVPCALVTMSYSVLADAVVAHVPGAFTTLVTGDQVSRGKPDPEPYLVAAARLGVAVGECVAIEDSPTGITSALAAGTRTLGVEAVLPVEPRPGLSRAKSLVDVDLDVVRRIAGGEVVDLLS
ncbi:HAD family hydrolase [Isoptericola dokdonensis]|jgi:HAD superfamily hydrolase (TIGR01509 family)|uniref:Phosphorylated carbohydrates phosphatase n=1 Tax=Isoptericola dokdonensis DS-3 TaxID=1300344 RepID=A0A161HW10_9MICO|nr:HAD family phosphatase [Isoptericola dokdonensis]ANC30353.1 Phosphorylated carbohydrates phosphatase [Isoptericola dokdonensis DS-3]